MEMAPQRLVGRARPSSPSLVRPVSRSLPRFISFPLEKFSYATLRTKDDKHTPYQHETSRNELFLVFDTKPTPDGQVEPNIVLKVLRGTQRLVCYRILTLVPSNFSNAVSTDILAGDVESE